MKKRALMIGLMAVMMCLAAGCKAKREEQDQTKSYDMTSETEEGNMTADSLPAAETIPETRSAEENNGTADTLSDAETISETQSAEGETVQELRGIVIEIEGNRITISQDIDPGEVDIYVDDSTIYELQVLSNEGADVKSSESSFDEIRQDKSLLRVTGHWTGTEFYAEKIINRMLAN